MPSPCFSYRWRRFDHICIFYRLFYCFNLTGHFSPVSPSVQGPAVQSGGIGIRRLHLAHRSLLQKQGTLAAPPPLPRVFLGNQNVGPLNN